jgi:sodium-dependent dicarboxylate transporter 2/3/5
MLRTSLRGSTPRRGAFVREEIAKWQRVAQAAGVRPVEPALGATLGASMGFMMPISTAPNAIVYSSGFIPITAMMRYGIALDVVAFVLIVAAVMLAGPLLF